MNVIDLDEELQSVSGGVASVVRYVWNAFLGDFIVTTIKDMPMPAFQPLGIVGPGSMSSTNVSSINAINGSDSMSDHYSGGAGGFGGGGAPYKTEKPSFDSE